MPNATWTMPAATAAQDPLDEPPGVCPVLAGLRVLPGLDMANSVDTVLPRTRPPIARVIATHGASQGGRTSGYASEP